MKKESNEIIPGVVCAVSSCSYNDQNTHCTAKQIAIGPKRAVSCAETVCATYKPDSEQAEGKIFN